MSQILRRVTVYFVGRVQGVGFRYAARSIALNMPVAGYVRNLEDGRVLLVAEGDEQDLKLLIAKIKSKMRDFVHEALEHWSEGSGEFGPAMLDSFTIRH